MRKRANDSRMEYIQPKIIRFLLFITKGEILYITLATGITVLIIIFALKANQDINNVVELSTFSAVVLEGGLVAVVGLLRSKILNYIEDPKKLTDNYQNLVKRYASEPNLIWKRNQDGNLSVFPVVHIAWLSDKDLIINDHPEHEYMLPDIIDKHYEELFRTHPTSKIYNNTNIRVDDWFLDDESGIFVMSTGRTNYYNSLVTNRAMDYELENGISVRELLECGPIVHPLKYSSLSNHLGFNGFVESSDNKIMFVKRKNNVSVGKRTWGNSIGASLKTKYALNEAFLFTKEGLVEGIIREIEDELGIPAITLVASSNEKSNLDPITIIAAYRDMLEGGKPQLMFFVKTSMSSEEIRRKFNTINDEVEKTRENYNRAQNEKEMETDGDELYWIPTEEIASCDVYSNKIIHKGRSLKMLPSAAACVAMFAEYICNNRTPSVRYSLFATEQFLMGKYGCANTCEDALFIGKRFVAVIDGVTAKGTMLFDGKTSGKYAAEIIVKAFSQLDHAKQSDTDVPEKVLSILDEVLMGESARFAVQSAEDKPRASVVYYDRLSKIVVLYGDCKFKVGDKIHDSVKRIDSELSEKREIRIRKALAQGDSLETLRHGDPGREAIFQDLKAQFSHENRSLEDDPYGYPVLNGNGICKELIVCYNVYEGEPVILCSDGYPKVCDTLSESESVLSLILKEDPLLIGDNCLNFRSTKGLQENALSFDDRAWVKLG